MVLSHPAAEGGVRFAEGGSQRVVSSRGWQQRVGLEPTTADYESRRPAVLASGSDLHRHRLERSWHASFKHVFGMILVGALPFALARERQRPPRRAAESCKN